MDLSWLEALVVTVDHGSFQAAALRRGVSRATLRSRVEALESQVGRPLLVRTIRGVELTDAGRPFVTRARALLADAAALARSGDDHAAEVTGEVRLCVPIGMPPQVHLLALARIRQRYPHLRIHFDIHPDPAAAGSAVDFIMHFCPRVTRGDFHTARLLDLPVRLVASPAYLKERGAPQELDELKGHTLLSWVAPGDDGTRLPLQAGRWVEADPAFRSPDIGVVRALAAAGLGIGLVPDQPELAEFIGAEQVVQVLPDVVGREISLWLLMPTARASANRTRAVVEITRDIAEWIARRAPTPP